ncbi:MAG: RNA polymerase sigma-70 factor [Dysgonamonadaceae bacterium]|jgi:RNA polymerase sigma-70 factor (ECF subfamily)|nr:RNA polymerase sigma-70 factor [Dysgonamonadaceae bacterium]
MRFIRDHDLEEKYEKFFMENYPRVKAFAKQILLSNQDAEDIAQDVFLKLMDKPEIWKDEEQKDGYLYKTTKNHIFNFIKRRNIERKYKEETVFDYAVTEDFGLEEKLYVKEIRLIAAHIIEQMPDTRKKIFKMSRYEGKSNRQIAEIMNMSVRTVEHHIYLALANLKKTLNLYSSIK